MQVGLQEIHALLGRGLPLEPEGKGNNSSQHGSQAETAGDLIMEFAWRHLLLLLTQELGQELGQELQTAGNLHHNGEFRHRLPMGGRFTGCWLVPWATLLPSIHNW